MNKAQIKIDSDNEKFISLIREINSFVKLRDYDVDFIKLTCKYGNLLGKNINIGYLANKFATAIMRKRKGERILPNDYYTNNNRHGNSYIYHEKISKTKHAVISSFGGLRKPEDFRIFRQIQPFKRSQVYFNTNQATYYGEFILQWKYNPIKSDKQSGEISSLDPINNIIGMKLTGATIPKIYASRLLKNSSTLGILINELSSAAGLSSGNRRYHFVIQVVTDLGISDVNSCNRGMLTFQRPLTELPNTLTFKFYDPSVPLAYTYDDAYGVPDPMTPEPYGNQYWSFYIEFLHL